MGCILYELAVRKKAFENDYAVLDHRQSRRELNLNLEGFDQETTDRLDETIRRALQIEPTSRPSASVLHSEFTRYCPSTNMLGGPYVKLDDDHPIMTLPSPPVGVSPPLQGSSLLFYFLYSAKSYMTYSAMPRIYFLYRNIGSTESSRHLPHAQDSRFEEPKCNCSLDCEYPRYPYCHRRHPQQWRCSGRTVGCTYRAEIMGA